MHFLIGLLIYLLGGVITKLLLIIHVLDGRDGAFMAISIWLLGYFLLEGLIGAIPGGWEQALRIVSVAIGFYLPRWLWLNGSE